MNTITSLQLALNRYKNALHSLDISNSPLNKEQILEILDSRDNLQKQLESETKIPIKIWPKLV